MSELSGSTTTRKTHTIYWVRHGETVGNYERIYRDPMTAVLTDRGRQQAKLAGEVLSDVVFTRAYSSHFPRATETAKIILEQSKHSSSLVLVTDERIREREHGVFEGRSYDEGNAMRGKGIDENHPLFPYAHFVVEGTENVLEIIGRAHSFFLDLMRVLDESPSAETVLVIGHGYFTDLFMTHLGISNPLYKVNNYSSELTFTLQNCGYHKLALSSECISGDSPVICFDFQEFQKDEHLSATGFASVRD